MKSDSYLASQAAAEPPDNEDIDNQLDTLLEEASALAGRPVEYDETTDGKYVVLFMQFDQSPPPKGDTPLEAVQLFIDYMKAKSDTQGQENTKENTDDDRDRTIE